MTPPVTFRPFTRVFTLLLGITLAGWGMARAEEAPAKPAPKGAKVMFIDGVRQNVEYRLAIATDKKDPFYHKGENVTFTISLSHNGEPMNGAEVKWEISKDGVQPPLQSGKGTTQNGTLVVSGSLNEPGFLQCRADFVTPGQSVPTARGAAAIDASEIKPSMATPADFDAYWDGLKKLLKDTPANVKMTQVKSPEAGVECFDVQADIPGGLPFSAYLARPIGAKPGTLPAIVCTQGAGVAGSRLSIVAGWAKEGILALDFNAHGLPNGQPQKFYSDLYKGELKEYYKKNAESRDTIFFRVLYLRLMRALDIVTTQPEWDGKELIVHGRSQGGGQAIAAAGLDPRVTLMCAQIPALTDNMGPVVGRIGSWPLHLAVGKDGSKPDPKQIEAISYYDAVNFSPRAKAEGFFTLGFVDITVPPTGVYATYNVWPNKKDIVNFYRYGHIASPEGDEAVRKKVLTYLGKPYTEKSPATGTNNKQGPAGEEQ